MHFNSYVGGTGRQDLSPVCKRRTASVSQLDVSGLPERRGNRPLEGIALEVEPSKSSQVFEILGNPWKSFEIILLRQFQQLLQSLDFSNPTQIDLDQLLGEGRGRN